MIEAGALQGPIVAHHGPAHDFNRFIGARDRVDRRTIKQILLLTNSIININIKQLIK